MWTAPGQPRAARAGRRAPGGRAAPPRAGASVAVVIEQGPDLVGRPTDADRPVAGLEAMLVDDCAALPGGGIDLDGGLTADQADDVAGRDARGQHIGAMQQPRQLRRMGVEALDRRAGAQARRVVDQRMRRQPLRRSRDVPVVLDHLLGGPAVAGGDQQQRPSHVRGHGAATSRSLTACLFDLASFQPPLPAALDGAKPARCRMLANAFGSDTETLGGLLHADEGTLVHGQNTTARPSILSRARASSLALGLPLQGSSSRRNELPGRRVGWARGGCTGRRPIERTRHAPGPSRQGCQEGSQARRPRRADRSRGGGRRHPRGGGRGVGRLHRQG